MPAFVSTRAGQKGVRTSMRMDPALTIQMMAAFQISKAEVNRAADEAIASALPSIKKQSQREVPFREGTLASSWFERPRVSGRKREIDFGYDVSVAPYAWVQHETFYFNHPGGRKWKYLEDPVTEHTGRVGNDMGRSLSQDRKLAPRSSGRMRIGTRKR